MPKEYLLIIFICSYTLGILVTFTFNAYLTSPKDVLDRTIDWTRVIIICLLWPMSWGVYLPWRYYLYISERFGKK